MSASGSADDLRTRRLERGAAGARLQRTDESRFFGRHLQTLRVRRGLSQQALAERAGLSVPTVAALEQGLRRNPHPSTVAALASALDLAPSDASTSTLYELARSTAPIAPLESGATRVRLPTPPTALIGREAEVVAATAVLHPASSQTRLLTLVGPGGVGKTRLALAVADALVPAFVDGVFFVDLAPISDARLVPVTISHALDLRESSGHSARQLLLAQLRDRQLLLVLDNFEHLLSAALLVTELLTECPRLAVLVSSRAALRLRFERRFPVPPLPAPATDTTATESAVADSPAVRLFVARAQAEAPGFGVTPANARAVSLICRRLDGLPLALELAAAWLRLFSPETLLARLEQHLLQLPNGPRDAPARQQTLRATLDWSYALLGPAEQRLFRRLSVFPSGGMLDAVVEICGDADADEADVLANLSRLIDQSLVEVADVHTDQVRVRLLTTIREYGWALLTQAGEVGELRRAHAEYYLVLAEQAEPQLTGPDQAQWLSRLEREHDNLRAVLAWACESRTLELGLRLAGAMWRFWWVRGHLAEGRRWLTELLMLDAELQATTQQMDTRARAVRARALNAAGGLALGQGDYTAARASYEESLELGRAGQDPERIALALHNLGYLALEQGDTARAWELSQASLALASAHGNARVLAITYINLGEAARQQQDLARATELIDAGLSLARRRGDQQYVGVGLMNLGHVASDGADWDLAERDYAEALRTYQSLGDGYTLGIAAALDGLARVANARGGAWRAAQLLGAASATREALGALLPPPARIAHERAIDAARGALGEATFAAAWQAGCGLSINHAVDLALRSVAPEPTANE